MVAAGVVESLRRRVAAALARVGVGDGDPAVVACSNGPDSLALADAMLSLRSHVTLVYVDHGLRPQAAAEGDAVRALARDAVVVRAEVKREGRGLEDAARRARHAALEAAADARGVRWIALGHTLTDQAETLVMRLLRGTGTIGLAGIAPRRGRFVRPLLETSRAEVLAYVEARGLRPSLDAMNEDPAFLRARVRHRILPLLREENPRLDEALARAAASQRELAEALDWAAARVPLAPADLARVPAAIARRALAVHAERLGAPLEARHLDALLALALGPAAGTRGIDLPGLRARREYDALILEPEGLAGPAAAEIAIAEVGPPRGPYRVRTWAPGDRMRPAQLRGRSRKLQDLFTDRKVPVPRRRAARVVWRESDGEIVWAEHIGHSHDAGVEVTLRTP